MQINSNSDSQKEFLAKVSLQQTFKCLAVAIFGMVYFVPGSIICLSTISCYSAGIYALEISPVWTVLAAN